MKRVARSMRRTAISATIAIPALAPVERPGLVASDVGKAVPEGDGRCV
jgi:hypothetical protein